jgi:MFS family permease
MSEPHVPRTHRIVQSTPLKPVLTMITTSQHASASSSETRTVTEATYNSWITTSSSRNKEPNTLNPPRGVADSEKIQFPQQPPSVAIFPLPMSKTREIGFIFIISMLQILPMVQMSAVLPTSQIIAQSFNITDKGLLPWTLAAYGLTFGTFILVSGRFGDMFGHKNMVIIGFAWMALWSIIAGLSVYSSYILFLFARAFQGMGSALMQPNGLALLGKTYASGSKKKNMIFALFGAMAPTGAYLGVTFGALFAQLVWWPWMFFVASMVCVFLAFLASVILPKPPSSPTRTSVREKLQDMDWLGAFSGITALVCVNIAWNCAPAQG